MAWPADERPESTRDQRIIVRRLRAREASVTRFEVRPRWEFGGGPKEVQATPYGATFRFAAGQLAVWTSFPIRIKGDTGGRRSRGELPVEAHYVAGKVMSWVVLERAEQISRLTGFGEAEELVHWHAVAEAIHVEVMEKGWSQHKNSFVQRYYSEALDGAGLLIPLMGFLPANDPRVAGTIAAIERELTIDGLVHRFDPGATLGGDQLPLDEFEGAFLPVTFWFAHALAKVGRMDQAEAILKRCEAHGRRVRPVCRGDRYDRSFLTSQRDDSRRIQKGDRGHLPWFRERDSGGSKADAAARSRANYSSWKRLGLSRDSVTSGLLREQARYSGLHGFTSLRTDSRQKPGAGNDGADAGHEHATIRLDQKPTSQKSSTGAPDFPTGRGGRSHPVRIAS
jgi:Glycosyl hydrolases family 15